MATNWYVCYCEPRKSLGLVAALGVRGVEAECPSFRFRRRVPRRKRVEELELPLIGGIFFLDTNQWPLGRGMLAGVDLEHVHRMLGMGTAPAVIADDELQGLRQAASERTRSKVSMRPGSRVEVAIGPFLNHHGTVTETKGSSLLVDLDGFNIGVEFSAFLLRKLRT